MSFSADTTEIESGEEVTLSFSVDGQLPEEGLPVAVDSDSIRTLSNILQFDENENPVISDLQGLGLEIEGDVDDSGFFVTLNESEGSITLPLVSPSGGEGGEGSQPLTFNLLDGENYGVDSQANEATVTINPAEEGEQSQPALKFGSLDDLTG